LLAQVDGICKVVTNENLFRSKGKNRNPRVSAYIEQITADSYTEAILSPLASKTPISASERDRGDNFHHLNRHLVLHGESTDYGTKVNSIKAISLINYVVKVLCDDSIYYA